MACLVLHPSVIHTWIVTKHKPHYPTSKSLWCSLIPAVCPVCFPLFTSLLLYKLLEDTKMLIHSWVLAESTTMLSTHRIFSNSFVELNRMFQNY